MRVDGKGSWKEREVGKFEVGKLRWSWKEHSEVGKNRAKLERSQLTCKGSNMTAIRSSASRAEVPSSMLRG